MNCPNCQKPFVKEQAGKFQCVGCGWFEKVDDEWRVCDAPASPSSDERDAALSKAKPQDVASVTEGPATGNDPPVKRSTKNLGLGPQPPEPDGPQPPEPGGPQPPEPVVLSEPETEFGSKPEPKVKSVLGGLITITEVEE